MEHAQLHTIDVVLIIIYLALVTRRRLWLSRGVKSSKDFFLAGRSLPWWAVGMSLVVSDIGAKDMVGLAGDAYRYGIVMMNFDFIGCAFPVLVAAFLFMPFFWMAGVFTIPEYLGRRYNVYVRMIFALMWTLFMVGTLGTIFRQRRGHVQRAFGLELLVLRGHHGPHGRGLYDNRRAQGGGRD